MSHPNAGIVEALRAAGVEVLIDGDVRVFLTRRNLEALLSKLDANMEAAARGEKPVSMCTLVKNDTRHPKYPQTHPTIVVKALENEEYYDRDPGELHPREEKRVSH